MSRDCRDIGSPIGLCALWKAQRQVRWGNSNLTAGAPLPITGPRSRLRVGLWDSLGEAGPSA